MRRIEERTFEEDLKILLEKSRVSPILSIKEILDALSGKGRSLILIFLSLPFCQPLIIPGMSIPFGIVISLVGLRMAFGKRIWLPKRILLKTISSTTIEKITEKGLKLMNRMRHFMHPRFNWVCEHGIMQVINGLLIFILGVFLALPVPIPLTNLAAGWSIFLVSLGLLENDGVFVLIGYAVSVLTLIFFLFILFSIRIAF